MMRETYPAYAPSNRPSTMPPAKCIICHTPSDGVDPRADMKTSTSARISYQRYWQPSYLALLEHRFMLNAEHKRFPISVGDPWGGKHVAHIARPRSTGSSRECQGSTEATVKHQPTQYISDVELVKRYSNPVYQGKHLRQMVELAEKSAKSPARTREPLPPEQRVDRRLSRETIAELVQTYRDGASTTQLRQQYELGQGSVIKILHEHGVVMRNQGLADDDLSTAATLYDDGQTLAELGQRFEVSPNAVRRALVSVGVVMRARGGSKPRG